MTNNSFLEQLDAIIVQFYKLKDLAKYDDLSDLPTIDRQALVTQSISAIHRSTPNNSIYRDELDRILSRHKSLHTHTEPIIGIIKSLRDDIKAGYIASVTETIHGDMFSDFIDMAQHLIDNKYKDAAAVIVGSTLESHLRSLCIKWDIETETTKGDGRKVSKKADTMNSELAAKEVYNKLDQKNVTAWLDLRNNAAHGKYDQYSLEQVTLFISSVRDFIARNPA